jgi:hypothetical protein
VALAHPGPAGRDGERGAGFAILDTSRASERQLPFHERFPDPVHVALDEPPISGNDAHGTTVIWLGERPYFLVSLRLSGRVLRLDAQTGSIGGEVVLGGYPDSLFASDRLVAVAQRGPVAQSAALGVDAGSVPGLNLLRFDPVTLDTTVSFFGLPARPGGTYTEGDHAGLPRADPHAVVIVPR